VSEHQIASATMGAADKRTALFYRRRTNAQGEVDEICLGACCVNIVRCLVVLALGTLMVVYGTVPLPLLRLLLKLIA
jgi:hypothetical protein